MGKGKNRPVPEGEIDGRALMHFGQILAYLGSIFGVEIYVKDLIKRANKQKRGLLFAVCPFFFIFAEEIAYRWILVMP